MLSIFTDDLLCHTDIVGLQWSNVWPFVCQLEYLHIPADVSAAFHHLEAHFKSPQPFLAAASKMSFILWFSTAPTSFRGVLDGFYNVIANQNDQCSESFLQHRYPEILVTYRRPISTRKARKARLALRSLNAVRETHLKNNSEHFIIYKDNGASSLLRTGMP